MENLKIKNDFFDDTKKTIFKLWIMYQNKPTII